jgi:hypothetical protein
MIEVRYAVFCDHALVDRGGKLSIIGIFDAINPPQLPFNIPALHVVIGFEAEAADAQEFAAKYAIWGQDGNPLFERETTLRFPAVPPGNLKRYNDVMALFGLPVSAPGPHSLIVHVNNEIRKRVVLDVNPAPGVQP